MREGKHEGTGVSSAVTRSITLTWSDLPRALDLLTLVSMDRSVNWATSDVEPERLTYKSVPLLVRVKAGHKYEDGIKQMADMANRYRIRVEHDTPLDCREWVPVAMPGDSGQELYENWLHSKRKLPPRAVYLPVIYCLDTAPAMVQD